MVRVVVIKFASKKILNLNRDAAVKFLRKFFKSGSPKTTTIRKIFKKKATHFQRTDLTSILSEQP